jgi:hypothetical protein
LETLQGTLIQTFTRPRTRDPHKHTTSYLFFAPHKNHLDEYSVPTKKAQYTHEKANIDRKREIEDALNT